MTEIKVFSLQNYLNNMYIIIYCKQCYFYFYRYLDNNHHVGIQR